MNTKPKWAIKTDMSGPVTKFNVTKRGKVVKECDSLEEAHSWVAGAVDQDRWEASNR